MNKKWLDYEIQLLKKPELTIKKLITILKRTESSISNKCCKLKIKKDNRIFFSSKEIKILKNSKLSFQKLNCILKKDIESIKRKCWQLKIKREKESTWTNDEIKLIKNELQKNNILDYDKLMMLTGRSKSSLKHKLSRLNLTNKYPNKDAWKSEEIKLLKNTNLSFKDISKITGRTVKAIGTRCEKLSIIRNPRWTKEEEKILYNLNLSCKNLSKILGKRHETIQAKRQQLNIKRGQYVKYPYNDFFKSATKTSMYALGLWWADGYIDKHRFAISSSNYEHLFQVKNIIGVKSPIPKTSSNGFQYIIGQKEIVKDIQEIWGGKPNKSLTATPPKNFSEIFFYDFLTGFIDGDGWLMISGARHYPDIGWIGTKEMMNWIITFLGKPTYIRQHKNGHNTWYVHYRGEKAQEIAKKLYLDNPQPYHMQRKYKMAKKLMQWKRKRLPRKNYTSKEISLLYDTSLSYKILSKKLNRSIKSIGYKCQQLNIKRDNHWSFEEIQFISDVTLSYKQLSQKLNRSINSLRTKCYALDIKRNLRRRWSSEEIQLLYDISISYYQLSQKLNRSINSLKTKCSKLKIKRLILNQ